MKRLLSAFLLAVLVAAAAAGLASLCCCGPDRTAVRRAGSAAARQWAERIELPGCPNLHRVTDDLYRGAQPTAEGFAQLQRLGIKTVVNLRASASDLDEIGGLTLGYVHIRMDVWRVQEEDLVRFLKVVSDPRNAPCFVHCQHGADRTGVACAVFRVAVQGWSKQEAIREMTEGRFGFHPVWQNLVSYVRDLDVGSVRQRAGLGGQPVPR